MQRLIDANALIPMMKYATTDSEIGVFPIKIGFDAITEVINNAPTIDAVPVVRCWACEYYRTEKCPMLKEQNSDGFCSFGKVRVY